MKVMVHLPTPLRRFTDGAENVTCAAATLPDLLSELEERFPGLGPHLRDATGRMRPFINVYVNEEDIRFLGGNAYRFRDGDEVLLVPSIAGGCPTAAEAVIVPASSANLGCAFDCAAVALNRYLKARLVATDRPGFRVFYTGYDAERVPTNESNLLIQALRRVAVLAGAELPGAGVEVESEIPIAAGLGSSAAAIVAGILLGARLCSIELEPATVLRLGLEIEGHPDNVAAAYYGGLVVAASTRNPTEVFALKTSVPPELEFIAVTPELVVSTERARAVLPEHYSRRDAVHNLQRVALLAATCFSGKFDLMPELFRDRFHQPYRSQLIPGLEACLEVRHPDLLGVFLSGAGSSVLALARHSADVIGGLLVEEFRRQGIAARVCLLKAENRGACDWEAAARARVLPS